MSRPRLRRCGDVGWLIELGDNAAVHGWAAAVRRAALPGVVQVVPGLTTLLVEVDPEVTSLGDLRAVLLATEPDTVDVGAGEHLVVEVEYDGADLADVARLTGLEEREVVAAHTGTPWRVAFCGFAPGFAYLVGGDPRLDVPRRGESRVRVPAGAVALAGTFSAVYPRVSPGGWQLLGHTDAVLWDTDADPPAVLRPGMTVGFREVAGVTWLRVEAVGPLALVEDRGRPGLAHLGVGRSGAADLDALALGNRLVGNQRDAAGIEATLGGLVVRLDAPTLVAITGATAPVRCAGREQAVGASFYARAGELVEVGTPTAGLRCYLAVRGGLVGRPVLGSMSWDTLARLGTPPLQVDDELPVGEAADAPPPVDQAPSAAPGGGPLVLPLAPGPRQDWFTDQALEALWTGDFVVTADTDRVGARLDGPALPRARSGELSSEGIVTGALQVPPDGRPSLLLADHPVTGGYPVVGVVPSRWVSRASQAVPGRVLRFRPVRG